VALVGLALTTAHASLPLLAVLYTAPVAVGGLVAGWAQSLRMRLVPPEAHGRLFALLRTAMQATPPAGAALAALVIGRGAGVTVAVIAATYVPSKDPGAR
jgi:hypothetical protein